MEKLQLYKFSSLDLKPSPVVALATSIDGSQVAAARDNGCLEIWLVSPGSVGWHCQLIIQGNPSSRVSSIVWCRSTSSRGNSGRLFSSSIDGTISEWDLFSLKQEIVLDSVGVSIWQMALEPSDDSLHFMKNDSHLRVNGCVNDNGCNDSGTSDSDEEDDSHNLHTVSNEIVSQRLAIACDDGCIRLYTTDSDGLTYRRTFPRVSGRVLSIAWSLDAKLIFSGSSDGLIRCWDAMTANEAYRITIGLGGLGSGSELCVWSLLYLRSGTLVSADSTGSVQFWDSHHGTLLQVHSYHKGDVNALATIPSHNRVFSAGSDGQVILYKLYNDTTEVGNDEPDADEISKWVYVGYVRAHTHDVRALTVAMPICSQDCLPNEKPARCRRREKPISFSYHKWAKLGVPMLISAGDDTKLFAYSAREFTQFSPHDICPIPQRMPIHLALTTKIDGTSLIFIQSTGWLDVLLVHSGSNVSGSRATTQLLARVKSKGSRKIICSTISSAGMLFAYSDHVKPRLFELRRQKVGKSSWAVVKRKLPQGLPFAHSMVFSADSSRIILAGHDRKIYVVDVDRAEILHSFTPRRKEDNTIFTSSEPPITRMFTSADGQWLAAINCFGDIYVFNLEINRQHWFISRLEGASVTAGGFPPKNSNVIVITTSSNQVYVLDVEAKQLGEWSRRHTFVLPRRFQEFPGEVIGLSFPPSCSTYVIVYSARAMCSIDFGMPVDQDDNNLPNGGSDVTLEKLRGSTRIAKAKRKLKNQGQDSIPNKIKNFDFCAFKDPVLFVGHLSESSLLVIEKPWMEIARTFDAPVHRHIFGT